MNDLNITDDGDLVVDPSSGDLKLTAGSGILSDKEIASTLAQIALIALKTSKSEFLLHPTIGNRLDNMIGLPNKPQVAKAGEQEIRSALKSFGIENQIIVESWPENENTISYEIKIAIGSKPRMLTFTIQQVLDDAPTI